MARVLALLAVAVVTSARAEDEPQNTMSTGLGLRLMQVRDELIRPLRFAGPGLELRTSYLWSRKGFELDTRFAVGMDYIRDRYGYGAVPFHAEVQSALGYRAFAQGRHVVHLGGVLVAQHTPVYFFSWDEEHLYWILNYDLGPRLHWRLLLDAKSRLELELSSSLFGLVSRPRPRRLNKVDDLKRAGFWVSAPHRRLRFATLNDYVALRACARYTRQLKSHLSVRVAYAFGYRRSAGPETLQVLEQTAAFSVLLHFGRLRDAWL